MVKKVKDIWTYSMKDISKMPRLVKNFGTKYILFGEGNKSIPVNKKDVAMRYLRNTPKFRSRVNKPILKIEII